MPHTIEEHLYLDDDGKLLKEGEGRPTRALYRKGDKIPIEEARRLGLADPAPAKDAPKDTTPDP
jgi:hypothetical protein